MDIKKPRQRLFSLKLNKADGEVEKSLKHVREGLHCEDCIIIRGILTDMHNIYPSGSAVGEKKNCFQTHSSSIISKKAQEEGTIQRLAELFANKIRNSLTSTVDTAAG